MRFWSLLFVSGIIRTHQPNLFVDPAPSDALHTNFKVTIIYPFYKFFLPNLWQFESLRVIKYVQFELQSKFIFKLDIEILQSNAKSFRSKIKL